MKTVWSASQVGKTAFAWQNRSRRGHLMKGTKKIDLRRRHADLVRVTAESDRAAQSAVAASWRRSLLYHCLDPELHSPPERLEEARLGEARERLGPLVSIAVPFINRVLDASGRAGCSVLLTDANGVIVERRGLPGDDDIFADWGLWTGAVWSESREGTNGIGTCIAESRQVTILQEQHFRTRNIAMSCVGAPLFDHEGVLAGVLDASSCRADNVSDVAPLLAAVIADAAVRIETEMFRIAYPSCRIVLAPTHGHRGPALLAVDEYDLLIGATRLARQSLGLTRDSFGKPVGDVLANRRLASDLLAAEHAEMTRAVARNGGNISDAAQDLGIGRATLYRRMKKFPKRYLMGPG